MNNGWPVRPVGEIAKRSLGKMLDKAKNKGTPRPYLRNVNVRWFGFDLSDLLEMRFLDDESDKFTAVKGDVLICEGGYPGRAAIWNEDHPIHFQKAIHRVRFHEPERNRWFLYYIYYKETTGQLRQYYTGTGIQHFTGESLARLPLPLPPLPEQRRIVGILDEAFDGITTATANAEKNLQNARALFESHLQAVFTQRGDGWVEKPLGECVQDISTGPFGSLLHKSDYEHGEIPLVNPINIEGDEIIADDHKAVGIMTAQRLSRYVLRENDIVIARRGEIGRCAVVTTQQAGWLCGTGSFFIRPSGMSDPHYLAHLLRSRPYRSQLERVAGRATMPSISNNDLAKLVVSLPPVAVQRRTLALLKSLSDETQRLESIYKKKLDALVALKKSLLHQAFSGQL